MPDIAAGPGFRGVRCSAFLAFAQHPFHPKRAGPVSRGTADPCYPTRSPPPLQAKAARRKDASHRTLQPTFSTGTGRTARFLPPGALHSAPDEVETSVDAASPASGLLSTLARGGTAKRGAPHRSGTALRRRSRPRTALEARPSDARVPIRPLSPTGRAVSVVPPSRDTPSSAQGAFPRQVLPASLARRRTPATVPGALPPPDRLPAPRRSSLALGRAGPAASSEAHTPGEKAGQALLSTSAITTVLRHDHGSTDHPAPRLELPPWQPRAAVRWKPACTTGQAFSEPGATEDANVPASASQPRSLAGELCPDPIGSDTSCHGFAPAPAGEPGAGCRGESPRNRRRATRSAARSRVAAATPPRRGA